MLIEFSVENFKSIKEKATLSMLASARKEHDNNLIRTKTMGKDRLLRSSVIYGANASGKSNVISALGNLQMLVLSSHDWQKGQPIPHFPFKLDRMSSKKPTSFSITFIEEGIRYQYGVSFDSKRIMDEFLYAYPEGRRSILFERRNTSEYHFTKKKDRMRMYEENTPENVLYLARATQLNCDLTLPAYEWFRDHLGIMGANSTGQLINYTANRIKLDKRFKQSVIAALNVADIDIDGIEVTEKKMPMDTLQLPQGMMAELRKVLPDGEMPVTKITMKHGETGFNIGEESEGTQKLFALTGPWMNALSQGGTLLIDELDTQLHHLLVVHLIKTFHDPSQNKKNAQLIFATHNLELLDQDIFRRDQIWFTEKNPDTKGTDLYSLVEYKPRNDKDIKRGYLAGRYGALPFIRSNRMFP